MGYGMGWNSGGELLGDIILSTQKAVPAKYRKELYKLFINHFEMHDCDVIYECKGLDKEFDKAYNEYYSDEEE